MPAGTCTNGTYANASLGFRVWGLGFTCTNGSYTDAGGWGHAGSAVVHHNKKSFNKSQKSMPGGFKGNKKFGGVGGGTGKFGGKGPKKR